MMKNEIGMNAGRIWQHLSTKGESTFKEIKSEIKLKDNEIYLALGWLARENNIFFFDKGEKQMIALYY